MFRSLYRMRAFNGDPHPGNYVFRPGGHVTFLDFGLVKHFAAEEIEVFSSMIRTMVLEHDPAAFRAVVEDAGLLVRDAPIDTADVGVYFSHFYDFVRSEGPATMTAQYASETVRRTFDTSSPITRWATIPPAFVLIQRINLGLYAILGRLHATADWRHIAEELWPMTSGPPSTPIGREEAAWLAQARS